MPVPQPTDTADRIAPALRDGYEVHRAALRRGLDGLLLPRQVLTVAPPDGAGELAFVHGVPQSSTLSGVTYAQDKRMRRDLLARAGLPVPPGATFAIGRELAQAKEFARGIGYPVVVKPAVGDNMTEVLAGLRDESQLDAAIEYLRTPELERPAFRRAAYALTLLLEPVEKDGRAVAPAGYQFLVERHVSGRYLRLLVQGDRVISAVACLDGPDASASDSYRDVTGELHPSLGALAVDATRAVPGLAVAAVDLVLADHRLAAADQQLWIVDLSERPLLAVQARLSEQLSHELGDAILTGHAAESGRSLGAPRDEITIDFQVEGATDPAAVAAAISAAARRSQLVAFVDIADPVEGTLAGSLQGSPDHIAWIFESLLHGGLDGQRAMLVDERQRDRHEKGITATSRGGRSGDGWRAEDLETLVPGRWLTRPHGDWQARRVATRPGGCKRPQTLFVAIDRETWLRSTGNTGIYARWSDTHDKVAGLVGNCVGAIVQRPVEHLPDGFPQYLVEDSYAAVLALAKEARERMTGAVVAITGTVGKSTVKDMLAHALSAHGTVVATRGNENTRSGVPLTLANAVTDPRFCVLEVAQSALWSGRGGVSGLVRPHIAVVTQIGITQASRVSSEGETARVKARVAKGIVPGGAAILNRDMACFDLVRSEVERYGAQVMTYGYAPTADVRVLSWEQQPMMSTVRVAAGDDVVDFSVRAPGRGMVANALAVICVSMRCGLDLRQVADEISAFSLPGAKLLPLGYQLDEGELTIIDDSYSAAPLAMEYAFEVLQGIPVVEPGRKIAVLGRMVDLGELAEPLHRRLAEPLREAGFELVITHGEEMRFLRDELPEHLLGPHFDEASQCARAVVETVRAGDVVLIKGSRRASDFGQVGQAIRSQLVEVRAAHPVPDTGA